VTPLLIEHGGKTEVVFQSAGEVVAHDAATGKRHWRYEARDLATISSPVFARGMLFVPGARFLALRPESSGEPPPLVWQSNKLPANFSSPTYYEDRIYTVSTRGVVNCAEAATGKPLWSARLEGPFAASPLAADGKIYVVNEEGATTVLRAGGKAAEVLATNALGEKILASPAAANGALYLRSDGHLYCIAARK
jgi:outer membrane protein assembly factor BamB